MLTGEYSSRFNVLTGESFTVFSSLGTCRKYDMQTLSWDRLNKGEHLWMEQTPPQTPYRELTQDTTDISQSSPFGPKHSSFYLPGL